jgi:broad specificity phosphatase PhoE
MTLYILRHAETEFNRLGLVQGSGIDSDLNDTGRQQARAFFEGYHRTGFELVVTSKLKRTHQTVGHFIQQGLPWVELEELNEISWGEHEGLPATPERVRVYEEVVASWTGGRLDAALPGGETARQLETRLRRFLDWLQTRPEKKVLICTHGRTMRCLIALLKAQSPVHMEQVRHANTGCYIVHWRDGRYEFECENHTGHLNPTAPF